MCVPMRIIGIFPIFFIVSRLKPYQEGQCSKYPNSILLKELTQNDLMYKMRILSTEPEIGKIFLITIQANKQREILS